MPRERSAARRLLPFAILVSILWIAPHGAVAQEPQKRVLVLYSARSDLGANIIVDRTLRSVLGPEFGDDLDLHTEFVDTARFPDADYPLALRDFLRRKYADQKLDAIFAVAQTALDFLRAFRNDLFPGVPMVAWTGRDKLEALAAEPNIAAVVTVQSDHKGTVELMRVLQPDLSRVVVVSGAAVTDRGAEAQARSELGDHEGLEITYLTGLAMDDLLAKVRQLPPRTAILYLPIAEDGAGRRFVSSAALQRIAEAASAPVYGTATSQLGYGIVGGKLVSQEVATRQSAGVIASILHGKSMGEVPIHLEAVPTVTVDWRQLRRWGIPEANVPTDAVVLDKQASVWETYAWQIGLALSVCLLQTGLIAGLLIQRARRHRAETEMQEQRRELAHLSRVATVGELSGALAHELNQPLTIILNNAQAAHLLLNTTPLDVSELQATLSDIVEANKRAAEIVAQTRTMLKKGAVQLQPLSVNDLVKETLDLARGELVSRGTSVVVRWGSDLPPVLADRVQVQQVILNLVLNGCDAMTHNKPDDRSLTLTTGVAMPDHVQLSVADCGVGIPAPDIDRVFEPFFTLKSQGLGLGLTICRSIVSAHNGRVWAVNNAERGTTFHMLLPVAPVDGLLPKKREWRPAHGPST